jgi:hypothetical protein
MLINLQNAAVRASISHETGDYEALRLQMLDIDKFTDDSMALVNEIWDEIMSEENVVFWERTHGGH